MPGGSISVSIWAVFWDCQFQRLDPFQTECVVGLERDSALMLSCCSWFRYLAVLRFLVQDLLARIIVANRKSKKKGKWKMTMRRTRVKLSQAWKETTIISSGGSMGDQTSPERLKACWRIHLLVNQRPHIDLQKEPNQVNMYSQKSEEKQWNMPLSTLKIGFFTTYAPGLTKFCTSLFKYKDWMASNDIWSSMPATGHLSSQKPCYGIRICENPLVEFWAEDAIKAVRTSHPPQPLPSTPPHAIDNVRLEFASS